MACHRGPYRRARAASTTSPTRSTSARTSCARPTSSWRTACIIETGPHKHAIQGTFFLYVWEPAGNRVEVANAGARLILRPDWEPVTWTEAERKKGQAWGLKTIASFHTHGTPPVGRVGREHHGQRRRWSSARIPPISSGAAAARSRCMRRRAVAVTVVCLSYGERGESAKLWRQPGMTLERVKSGAAARRRRTPPRRSASHDIQFCDLGDYPLALDRGGDVQAGRRLSARCSPAFVLTPFEGGSLQHATTMYVSAVATQQARIVAQAHGATSPARRCWARRRSSCSSRTSPSRCEWMPNVLLDITPVWEKKRRGHRVHGRPGASLGVLHARGRAARRAGCAQLRQEDHRRRSLCRGGLPVACFRAPWRSSDGTASSCRTSSAPTPGVIDRARPTAASRPCTRRRGGPGCCASYMRPIYAGRADRRAGGHRSRRRRATTG